MVDTGRKNRFFFVFRLFISAKLTNFDRCVISSYFSTDDKIITITNRLGLKMK